MKSQKKLHAIGGKLVGILLVLGIVLWIVIAAKGKNENPISSTEFKLNTAVTINIYDSQDERILNKAMELCDRYEQMFSRTLPDSEISKLNNGMLKLTERGYRLEKETFELIKKGIKYSEISDGAFDITIEPVSSLWDFTSENKQIPEQSVLSDRLQSVGYGNVVLTENENREEHFVQFQKEGMGIELGAIAKGYIADRIKEYLLDQGVESALIDLGGNVLCVGNRPDGQPFRIGVQKPFKERNETVAVVEVSDRSVVSSGIYERYFEKDGKLYHHILDPRTGYPYENDLLSVTIFSDASVDGDGVSTTCYALGLEKGMELVDGMDDVQALFITKDGELHFSKGFEEKVKIIK